MKFFIVIAIVFAVAFAAPSNGKCPANETFTQCGTACEPSCAKPNPTVCTLQCIVNVCQCNRGFVRNSAGKCVRQSEC